MENNFQIQESEFQDRVGEITSCEKKKTHPVAVTEEIPILKRGEEGENGKFRSRRQLVLVAIIATGTFLSGACVSLQGPFFPREAELKGATPTQYGLVFAVYQSAVFLSAPVYAKLLLFVSPMFMTNAGIFVLGGSCILFGLLNMAPTGHPFLILAYTIRIFEGMAASAFSTGSFAIIASEFSNKVATVYSSMQTCLGVGLIAGPTLGGLLYQVGGYTFPFGVVGGLLILLCIVGIFILPHDLGCLQERQGGSLRKFWLHTSTVIHALAITSWTMYIGYNSAVLEPFLRQFNLTPALVGVFYVIPGAVYAITGPVVGWICDKIKLTEIICTGGCFLCCVYLLLVGPAPFLPLETELWMIILSLIIFGTGISCIFMPATVTVMRDALERGFANDLTTYGMVSSLLSAAMAVGYSVGPSVGGYLQEHVGYRKGTGFLFCFAVLVFLTMAIHLFWRIHLFRRKKRQIRE